MNVLQDTSLDMRSWLRYTAEDDRGASLVILHICHEQFSPEASCDPDHNDHMDRAFFVLEEFYSGAQKPSQFEPVSLRT